MRGVKLERQDPPCLSVVKLEPDVLRQVMVLKYFTFHFVIRIPQIQAWEDNGFQIVCEIFKRLWADPKGRRLPQDLTAKYQAARAANEDVEARRIICDFIASMSDIYATEFYGRLTALQPTTIIFKMI